MLLSFSSGELDQAVKRFEYEPSEACDYLTMFVSGLKVGNQDPDFLLRQFGIQTNLLERLEHCLIQLTEVDVSPVPTGPMLTETAYIMDDPISTQMYIRKVIEFLMLVTQDKDIKENLFDSGMLNDTFIRLCFEQTSTHVPRRQRAFVFYFIDILPATTLGIGMRIPVK